MSRGKAAALAVCVGLAAWLATFALVGCVQVGPKTMFPPATTPDAASVDVAAPAAAVPACGALPDATPQPCPKGSGLVACFDSKHDLARKHRLTILHDAATGQCSYQP